MKLHYDVCSFVSGFDIVNLQTKLKISLNYWLVIFWGQEIGTMAVRTTLAILPLFLKSSCWLISFIFWIFSLFTIQMLSAFPVSYTLETSYPIPSLCFYEGVPLPTNPLLPASPGIPLHWLIYWLLPTTGAGIWMGALFVPRFIWFLYRTLVSVLQELSAFSYD